MRVLIVGAYYYPATCYGGPVWVLKDLARGLAGRGVEVEVITTSANQPHDDPPRIGIVDGIPVRYERRWDKGAWYFSPDLARSVERLAPAFDVISVQGLWTYPVLPGCATARHLQKPYVMVPHGSLDPWALRHRGGKKAVYLSLFEKRNLRHAAAVHCLTRREADQVRALVPGARCEVIPNAATIEPDTLTEAGRAAFAERFPTLLGKRVVLFLSRIHRKKGLDLLIPAFARVAARFPDAHLVIAGPDEDGYKTEVEGLIASHRIADRITFAGLLNGQDKLAAFDRADVFVLPSYSEGLPVVVLEALAFGKPVVITDPCNLTDEVQDAGAGLVVETTADAVARGLGELLADPARAREMGAAGRKLAVEDFSLEAVTGRLVELFEDILRRRRKR